MLIEAGGLNGHANVTQSPAVFLWNLHFFPVHLLPCFFLVVIVIRMSSEANKKVLSCKSQ